MLIEFSVTNFRSIKDTQKLSLAKAKGEELERTNTFSVELPGGKLDLLRSGAIYGANASGKSNFLDALGAMQTIVLNSATSFQRGDKLPVTPFKLSAKTINEPSEFEVVFIADGVRFQYGFSATADRVFEEWLIAYPKGRTQRWFERSWDTEKEEYHWKLGNSLVGEKHTWQKTTRGNALYLSTAVQLNSEQLQPVYDWFMINLRVAGISGWSRNFSASLCEDDNKSQILEFVRAADLDIHDILIESKNIDPADFPVDMPDHVRMFLEKEIGHEEVKDIITVHKNEEGELVYFDFEEESQGTRKFFAFAGPWIDALRNGYVLVVDELHDNFHPKLVKHLVQLFHSNKTNPKNAQLIFTTHETSILSQKVFRRDQIWFCEKNRDQSTTVYPLTDFSPRKGREDLEDAYLAGRYGALPYIQSLGGALEHGNA